MTTFAWEPAAPTLDPGEIAELQALLGIGFEHSALAMLLVGENVQTVCANASAGVLFGTERSALLGHRNADFAAVEWSADGERQTVAFRLGDLDHLERETDLATAAGALVRAKLLVDVITTDTGRRFILLRLRVITEDRARSDELAASELHYRLLVGNLPQAAVFLFDHDLRLLLAVCEALGDNSYEEETLTGRLLEEVLPQLVVDVLDGPYRAALAGQSSDFEYTSPTHGGQFRMRVRPVAGPDGRTLGGLATSEVDPERHVAVGFGCRVGGTAAGNDPRSADRGVRRCRPSRRGTPTGRRTACWGARGYRGTIGDRYRRGQWLQCLPRAS